MMPTTIRLLSLTHGQVLWALARGRPPEPTMVDQLRYLRQLGVPFRKSELGSGRGNRVRYRYEHLIELGVALFGLQRGMKPQELAKVLTERRKYLRTIYEKAFSDQPEAAIEADWVKSRGRIVPLLGDEIFLRLHDRHSDAPGKIEMLEQNEIKDLSEVFLLGEKYPGEKARTLLPLTRLVLELVAWAKEAPEIKPGP
jgi:hypothetical protein